MNHTEPGYLHLQSLEDVQSYILEGEFTTIGFFAELNSTVANTFIGISNSTLHPPHIAYGIITDSRISQALGVPSQSWPVVHLYRNSSHFQPIRRLVGAQVSYYKMTNMIVDGTTPLPPIQEANPTVIDAYHYRALPIVWLFFDYDSTNPSPHEYLEMLTPVAEKYFHNVSFLFLNGKKMDREMLSFGLETEHIPALSIVDYIPVKRNYPLLPQDEMKHQFTAENVEKHVVDFLQKKLKPHLRSEPAPDRILEVNEPVKTLVRKQWKRLVKNNKQQDVLVEFYAPWCHHCQAFESAYTFIGHHLKKEQKHLLIGKLDVTKNDILEAPLSGGYPQLVFYPAGKYTEPIIFDAEEYGGRNVETVLKFISEHATKLTEEQKKDIMKRFIGKRDQKDDDEDDEDEIEERKTPSTPKHDEL